MERFFDEGTKDISSHYFFRWDKLGDIGEGRKNLGETMPVLIYRMMEYSMNHVLFETYGEKQADNLFRKAGHLAGSEYAKNVLDLTLAPNDFLQALSASIESFRIGILRIEKADFEKGDFILTVHEDLDCSGLPPTGELVCSYDEGFLSGILETYMKKPVTVKEVDCWASGERVCRFRGKTNDAKE